jgi:hypothetical protein
VKYTLFISFSLRSSEVVHTQSKEDGNESVTMTTTTVRKCFDVRDDKPGNVRPRLQGNFRSASFFSWE